MNKTDLIYSLAEKCELSKKDSRKIIDTVLENISTALAVGEKVQLFGFGNFETRERAERKGRNPQTGEEITIAAAKYPSFSPGKELKDAVKQG